MSKGMHQQNTWEECVDSNPSFGKESKRSVISRSDVNAVDIPRNVSQHGMEYDLSRGSKDKAGQTSNDVIRGLLDKRCDMFKKELENDIIQQIQTLTKERDTLILKNEKLHGLITEYKQVEFDQKTYQPPNKHEIQEIYQQLDQYEQLVKRLYQENKELKEKLSKALEDKDRLTNRISSDMSAKLGKDESSFENISIKERPINVRDEYVELFSTPWMNAKESLKRMAQSDVYCTKMTDEDGSAFLTEVIMLGWGYINTTVKKKKEGLYRSLLHSEENYQRGITESEIEALPDHVKNSVSDLLRTTCPQTAIEQCTHNIKQNIFYTNWRKCQVPLNAEKDKSIIEYIDACAKLAWKMVNQRPPMQLRTEGIGQWFNDSFQEPFYGTGDPSKFPVKCYVRPALFHGDNMMVKGLVICKY